MNAGDITISCGYPRGSISPVLTSGIVSRMEKAGGYWNVHTTCSILTGNSGGGYFNEKGECIGIVSYILYSDSDTNYNRGICSKEIIKWLESIGQNDIVD